MNRDKQTKLATFTGILIVSFFFLQTALAAKLVPGGVPKLQPLQPIPEGIAPDVSKNVQSGSFAAPSARAPEELSGGEVLSPADGKPNLAAEPKSEPANSASAKSAFFWIFLLPVAVLALGWPLYKVWHKKRHEL